MKALAKVYPFLGSIRFIIVLLTAFTLSFTAYLWMKSPSHISAKSPPHLRCSNGNQVSFTAANTLHTFDLSESIKIYPFDFEGVRWDVTAVQTAYSGDVIADLVERNRIEKKPLLGFIQDAQDKEYVVLISRDGELSVSSVAWLLKNTSALLGDGLEVKTSKEMKNVSFYFKTWP